MITKKRILLLLSISVLLTTIGLWIDTDPKNPSIWTTVFEFAAMATILFSILSLSYFAVIFSAKKVKEISH